MVSSFYFARVNMPRFDEYERSDRPQFLFVTAADGEYIFADAHHAPVCRANIVGPTSGRVRAISNRPTQLVGFGMLPAGWDALMGDDADKPNDRAMNTAELFGPRNVEVATTLEQAATVQEKRVRGNTYECRGRKRD